MPFRDMPHIAGRLYQAEGEMSYSLVTVEYVLEQGVCHCGTIHHSEILYNVTNIQRSEPWQCSFPRICFPRQSPVYMFPRVCFLRVIPRIYMFPRKCFLRVIPRIYMFPRICFLRVIPVYVPQYMFSQAIWHICSHVYFFSGNRGNLHYRLQKMPPCFPGCAPVNTMRKRLNISFEI